MVTALPLQPGRLNLGQGAAMSGVNIVHCNADGSIELEWANEKVTPKKETYKMVAGEDVFTYEAKTVKVVTGEFTMARA